VLFLFSIIKVAFDWYFALSLEQNVPLMEHPSMRSFPAFLEVNQQTQANCEGNSNGIATGVRHYGMIKGWPI
jgi:hypothetical protein